MAAAKGAGSVSCKRTADGGYAIGATVDGVFVPFVAQSEARVQALVENAKGRGEGTDTDDEEKAS